MEFADVQRVDRQTWRKYLFYIDLIVVAIFAISLSLLVRHTFLAGQWYERGEFGLSTDVMWLVTIDTAFMVGSLMWILFRFFRNQYLVLTRRF
jgi:hypothetical protein